jgi:LL-diaminopimelate aminotransferase
MKLNKHYSELNESYLFSTIAHKVAAYQKANPDKDIIRLGIGDVTLPLAKSVTDAMLKAVEEQGKKETFHGYIPSEQGYEFLRSAIQKYYAGHGVELDMAEIFVSDGAKSDLGNLLDLFDVDNTVLVPDPVYPVYVDDNVMAGRKILYMSASAENNFLPMPDDNVHADIVYLCSPNNPTGATYTVDQLKEWVRWAKANNALILFDAAYECFVSEPGLARSIYEVEGAKDCAVEVCSFSKIAGFTGTRCGYTIVPKSLKFPENLNKMWLRRQSTKFNGVSYIIQCGANAVFTPEGQAGVKANIAYYQENAKILMDALDECGIKYFGGKNSPYIWLKCPNNMGSWEFFDKLLEEANVVGTPGEGFGENGKGYLRLTSFSTHENTREAMERLKKLLAQQ